jgi:hypothetical protein
LKTQLTLRLDGHLNSRPYVEALRKRLPDITGRSVQLRFLPDLRAGSRKLYSRHAYGEPVYAATFVHKRQIVLDSELAGKPRELARILTHEIFHFAWARLSNAARRSFENLLEREWKQGARGELGWSAELRKRGLSHTLRPTTHNPRRWRDYACESFCDTAAWMYSGVRRHPEFTLAKRHRIKRAAWFAATFDGRAVSI